MSRASSGSCTRQDLSTGETVTVTDAKFILCNKVATAICSCTSAGCSVAESAVPFDAALENDGAELVGSIVVGDHINVRLTRD